MLAMHHPVHWVHSLDVHHVSSILTPTTVHTFPEAELLGLLSQMPSGDLKCLGPQPHSKRPPCLGGLEHAQLAVKILSE